MEVRNSANTMLQTGLQVRYRTTTDISSTDISSTTVYQGVAQLYNQLLFQEIIIFINSNFYLYYDSFLSIPLPLTLLIIQHIQLASIVAWQSSLFFQLNTHIFINPTSS